jgi:hypothetical protein
MDATRLRQAVRWVRLYVVCSAAPCTLLERD